jgi:hypothetical protein
MAFFRAASLAIFMARNAPVLHLSGYSFRRIALKVNSCKRSF